MRTNRAFSCSSLNRSAAEISHPRAQTADQLIDHRLQRSAMRHPAFDPFRHKLRQPVLRCGPSRAVSEGRSPPRLAHIVLALEVALARTLRHRRERTHAAIRLERPPLVQNRLARAFIHARKQRPHHHHACARCNRLGHIAGVLDAAIRDHRNSMLRRRSR